MRGLGERRTGRRKEAKQEEKEEGRERNSGRKENQREPHSETKALPGAARGSQCPDRTKFRLPGLQMISCQPGAQSF